MPPAHRRHSPWYVLPVALGALAVASGAVAAQSEHRLHRAPAAAPVPTATTPALSARRVPALLAAPVADARLAAQLDALVAASTGSTCLEVTAGGRTIYAHAASDPLTPASLQKLMTGTAALSVLGPDTTLTTTVRAGAAPHDGVVDGDLYLVGAGDPLLMTADFEAHLKRPIPERTDLGALADRVVAAGVRQITGAVRGDDTRYDAERYPPSWPGYFATEAESGPISALTVNRGLDAYPPSQDTSKPIEHPAADPPANAAAVFAGLLAARGVAIGGGTGRGAADPSTVVVASLPSAPLKVIVDEMLRESDNLAAELLTKELGKVRAGSGDTTSGVATIRTELTRLGLPVEGTNQVDGSGLSELDKTTCAMVSAVLQSQAPTPFADGLPVAARTGTLDKRFAAAAGRLRAKTGTLNQVTALAGELPTAAGADVLFSYVRNLVRPAKVGEADLALEDQLVTILDSYPQNPDLAALGPLP